MTAAKLTAEQDLAAYALSRRLVLTAGAGAGKTATIAARIAAVHDYDSAGPGRRAGAIPCTRAAAAELRARAPHTEASTFHGFAIRLRRLATTIPFSVYDEVDARDVAILAGQEVGVLKADFKDAWKAAEKALKEPAARHAYDRILREARAFDYDGLITDALGLLARDELRPIYRRHFDDAHILVDEAQDTDARQWTVVERLDPWAVTVVGDPRQSIYGFRKADPARLATAVAEAPGNGWEALALTANFRSGAEVVDAANRIAEGMDFVVPPMVAARGDLGLVEAIQPADPEHEAALVAGRVVHAAQGWESGQPPRAFVLARRWSDLAAVRAELTRVGQAHAYLGTSGGWREDRDCRMLLRLASLVVNPWQDHWTRMLAGWGALAVPAGDLAQLALEAARARRPLVYVLAERRPAQWGFCAPHASQVAHPAPPMSVLTALAVVLLPAQSAELTELLALAIEWQATAEATDGERTLRAFLDALPELGRETTPDAPIWLTTVHGSKGLEAPLVCLVGCDVDGFPERGAESRRLFYVAVTRARDALLVTAPATRPGGFGQAKGRPMAFAPSPFLADVGAIVAASAPERANFEVSGEELPW